jgi:S1-C subfamily serine protease
MMITSVREGRTAAKAGIQDGDIVIKMGDVEVTDMMAYMKALGQFKKGEKTMVIVKRGDEELEFEVEF